MARENGWQPERADYEIGWDDPIGGDDDLVVVNTAWVEGKEITEPAAWDPAADLIRYLETLFDSSDNVGYVTQSCTKKCMKILWIITNLL